MIIKTTFKSHFKVSKKKINKDKSIFVRNMVVFFLFSKVFLKSCNVNLLFQKVNNQPTSFLKAPSRHKKFFHQVFFEFFIIKIFFFFLKKGKVNNPQKIFKKIDNFFKKIGTNVLTRTKISVTFNTYFNFKLF